MRATGKIKRLMRTIWSFENCCREDIAICNGELVRSRKKLMKSIIKQAVAIDAEERGKKCQ